MEEHSGLGEVGEGTGSVPAALRPYQPPSHGPSYLEILRRLAATPWGATGETPCVCLGCCRGTTCEVEIAQERYEFQRALDEERRRRRDSERGRTVEQSRATKTKSIAFDTIITLLEIWRSLSRAEQDRREAEYDRLYRSQLAILGEEDPDRWLPSPLLDKARWIGRPSLSGHWRTPESFRAEVDPLIRQLRAEGKTEGKRQVAEYMPAAGWRQYGQTVSLQARVRRLERATKGLLKMTWDEYARTVK